MPRKAPPARGGRALYDVPQRKLRWLRVISSCGPGNVVLDGECSRGERFFCVMHSRGLSILPIAWFNYSETAQDAWGTASVGGIRGIAPVSAIGPGFSAWCTGAIEGAPSLLPVRYPGGVWFFLRVYVL